MVSVVLRLGKPGGGFSNYEHDLILVWLAFVHMMSDGRCSHIIHDTRLVYPSQRKGLVSLHSKHNV